MALIFDFRWKDDLIPVFQTVSNGKFEEVPVYKDQPLFLSVESAPLICVGSFQNNTYSPCSTKTTGTKKCETCKRMEDYFPCQFCNGFNCHQFRNEKIENCDASHMVYLALFTKDIVKVGVSRLTRGKTRQVEQGSHFTRIFAEGLSGVAARRMEKILTEMGFPDKIPSSQKKDFLFPEISLEEGKSVLEQKAREATDFLASHAPEYKKYILSEEKFWDLRPEYTADIEELQNSTKPFHFFSLAPGESLGGTLRMVKGPFFVVEAEDERVALSAKDLVGYCVSFSPCENGLKTNVALQSSLF
ncbi:MAG: DUF2797 domain-containing protein [Candidatus Peregrinibacteria bacterium]